MKLKLLIDSVNEIKCWLYPTGTGVIHSTHNPEIEVLNPATWHRDREQMSQEKAVFVEPQ
jgi:hypothetical protein